MTKTRTSTPINDTQQLLGQPIKSFTGEDSLDSDFGNESTICQKSVISRRRSRRDRSRVKERNTLPARMSKSRTRFHEEKKSAPVNSPSEEKDWNYKNIAIQITTVIMAATILMNCYMLKSQIGDMDKLKNEISRLQDQNEEFLKHAVYTQKFIDHHSSVFELKMEKNVEDIHVELKDTKQNVSEVKEKLLDIEESVSILVREGRKFPSQFQNLTDEIINVSKVTGNFNEILLAMGKTQKGIRESIFAIEKIYESSVDDTQVYGQILKSIF